MSEKAARISESSYTRVKGNLGVTDNWVIGPDGGLIKRVVNAVRQHPPQEVVTGAGVVKNNTLTRISDADFPTVDAARKYIDELTSK
jgi:hypothetical protein